MNCKVPSKKIKLSLYTTYSEEFQNSSLFRYSATLLQLFLTSEFRKNYQIKIFALWNLTLLQNMKISYREKSVTCSLRKKQYTCVRPSKFTEEIRRFFLSSLVSAFPKPKLLFSTDPPYYIKEIISNIFMYYMQITDVLFHEGLIL